MRKNSSSSLFLMELILAILFFSLASTVCIKLFIQSHILSKTSVNLNNSILWCQNLAEAYDSVCGNISDLENYFPDIVIYDDASYTIYFDKDWNILRGDDTNASYYARIIQTDPGPLSVCHIYSSEINSDEVIYELYIKKYIPGEVSAK